MKISRRIAAAVALSLVPAALCAPALAQPASDDPITNMARSRFKEGVDFYDKGQFDQARASFLQAYALKKHPAVLLNLAWSCLKSGHALEAKKYFEQFLAESKDASDKQRADANDGLSQARAKLGRIEVQAAAGTEVTVDGERVGTAPMADAVAVEAGAHTVKFRGPDGAQDTQSVSVLGGQKAVARFGNAGPSATPPAVATTPATTPEAPAPTSPPAATAPTPAPAEAPAMTPSGAGFFTPPDNLVPVFILGGVAVAGFATSIVMAFSKQNAQNNADNVESQILGHGGGPGTCNSATLAADPSHQFDGACAAYFSDLNDVNQDATIANIGVGVGIAGAVGAVIYWAAASKTGGAAKSGSNALPVVMPSVGRSSGTMSLGWQF